MSGLPDWIKSQQEARKHEPRIPDWLESQLRDRARERAALSDNDKDKRDD